MSRRKRGGQRFVQIFDGMLKSDAWRDLKTGPRVLYIELKRRYNGSNNGQIFLSHRMAAEALNVGRDTVGKYYRELVDHGFILVTQGHCLGPSGIGQATMYRLTELPSPDGPATNEYKYWSKQKPSRETQHLLEEKTSTPSRKIQGMGIQKQGNPTALH